MGVPRFTGQKKISRNIDNQTMVTCPEDPPPEAAMSPAKSETIYRYYLMTIVSNTRLTDAPSFDTFYNLFQKVQLMADLSVLHSFYELQPKSHKIHLHAVVNLTKDNPNSFKFSYFPKLYGKGYNYDFKKIETVSHLLNCIHYENKDIPQ